MSKSVKLTVMKRTQLIYVLILTSSCVFSTLLYNTERGFLIDGKIATLGQFPYMTQVLHIVNISTKNFTRYKDICGAVLITPRWILTAGQCFPELDEEIKQAVRSRSIAVIANTTTSLDFKNGIVRFVVKMFRHPFYGHDIVDDIEVVQNDIAVAEVNRDFPISKFINLITFISPSYLKGNPITAKIRTCRVLGFGTAGTLQRHNKDNILRYLDIEIFSMDDFDPPNMSSAFIQAIDSNPNKNHADLGSPAICAGFQFGATSFIDFFGFKYIDLYLQTEQYYNFITKYVSGIKYGKPDNHRKRSRSSAGNIRWLQIFHLVSIVIYVKHIFNIQILL